MISSVQLVFFLAMGTFVIAGAALFSEWRRYRDPSALWWTAAFLASAVGSSLFPLRRYEDLEFVSIGVANAMFFLSYSAICAGIWNYYGRRSSLVVFFGPSLSWLLFWWLCPLASEFDSRVAVASVLTSIISIVSAFAALSGDAKRLGRALALLMTLRAGFFAIRAVWASAIFGPISDAQRSIGFEIVMIEGLWSSVIAGYLLLALLREKRERSLVKLAETDFLTGADNRRAFQLKAEAEFRRTTGRGETTLLMLDLDNFKHINDAYGHAFGDEVLKVFAAVVNGHVYPGDTFARLGGEEFALMLPDRDEAAAARLAETLRVEFAEAMPAHKAGKVSTTVSIGIASTRNAGSLDRLLAIADEALYRAKANGRNRVECGPQREPVAAADPAPKAAFDLRG